MKRTETVKVPTYKYVIEDVCCNCCDGCDCGGTVSRDIDAAVSKNARPAVTEGAAR
jgi:hypothetical protein